VALFLSAYLTLRNRLLKPFKYLLFLFPLLEIAGFIIVGNLIGLFPTLLLIILTTALGFYILKQENFEIMKEIQTSIQKGQPPMVDFMTSSVVMIGGLLLIIPGFITDIIGLLCLIPKLRLSLLKIFSKTNIIKIRKTSQSEQQQDVIEGEYWKDEGKEK